MPIPTPNADEKRSKFVSRCMNDAVMKREYPNQKQRAAICEKAFDEKKHAALIAVMTARNFTPCQIKAEIARIEREQGE
ncbi:MAG: hypothetical protein WC052_04580 [Patescibacteria group bacterium]|jgi:hypothetical protein